MFLLLLASMSPAGTAQLFGWRLTRAAADPTGLWSGAALPSFLPQVVTNDSSSSKKGPGIRYQRVPTE